MNIPFEPLIPAVMLSIASALGAWVWKIEQRVTSHDEVIKKVDQLVTILLQDRLSRKP